MLEQWLAEAQKILDAFTEAGTKYCESELLVPKAGTVQYLAEEAKGTGIQVHEALVKADFEGRGTGLFLSSSSSSESASANPSATASSSTSSSSVDLLRVPVHHMLHAGEAFADQRGFAPL